jgi:hypothetical protein
MFRALGVLVALYAIYGAISGKVYAKSGISGRMVSRQVSPKYFWVLIAIHVGVSLALIFVF